MTKAKTYADKCTAVAEPPFAKLGNDWSVRVSPEGSLWFYYENISKGKIPFDSAKALHAFLQENFIDEG